jgi:energy-coupling factor transporter ATP-binding protein EcfA2
MVGLEKFAHKLPLAVSTGQQQQAAIARALATNPALIAADEPTGNLDSRSAEAIINLFEQLASQGKTIVMVTHDPSITERMSRTIILSDGEIIDETVAHCLPLLNHQQMLQVTKHSTRQVFEAGETILAESQHVDQFFMIGSGEVEVVIKGKRHETIVTRLRAGEFFGEIELTQGGKSIACVRAAPTSRVEVLTIPRSEFLQLLQNSPLTAEAIARIVQIRLEEHRTTRGRK